MEGTEKNSMTHLSSYPEIYAIGHRQIREIFSSPVVIEEKVDGSQFSMAKIGGELCCRSKGKDIVIDAPEKMFAAAIETAKSLDLHDGWVYRGEYLSKPKHNTLAYSRIPNKHIILFDVMIGPELYLTPKEKLEESIRLGIECVPCLVDGPVPEMTAGLAETLLQTDSILGGVKVEGFVVKNYTVFTPDKKVAIAKYVSAAFKEKHQHEWKKTNPTQNDVVQHLIGELRTPARWQKAVQHLRDNGALTETPKDIGLLLKEIQADVLKEEADSVKECLFKHFWPQISRGIINGAPEWYKAQVGIASFEPQEGVSA
jgi:hypothetical protein